MTNSNETQQDNKQRLSIASIQKRVYRERMGRKKNKAGRKPLYQEELQPYALRLKKSQIVWLRQQENASVVVRDLIDGQMGKQQEQHA